MESVKVLGFTEEVGLAFGQGPETELFWTGIQGRVFPCNLDIGWRKGSDNKERRTLGYCSS
jgi:hypothetical protein